MHEEAWLDEGDVVIAGQTFEYFKKLIALYRWLEKNHPEILKEYNRLVE